MPETVTYRTSKGVYDIPKDKEKSFKDANPDAEVVMSFVVGKDTFDIPSSKVDAFLKAKPKAVPLKKNKSTEVSSKDSSPVSQDKEPTSTSLLDKVVSDGVKGDIVFLQEEAGIKTQPYKSPVAEKSEIESVIGEGAEKQLDERGEMRPEIKKELEKIPTFTELSDSETKKIAASYASTVDDKKTYSLIKDAVTRVEIDYARSGILTPGKKILAYSEATEPITAEYLSLLRGGYPTEEQRDAYVSKLKEVAKGLGADLNENYELVVDDEIYDRKVSENIGKMYGSVQQDTPYFQDLTNMLSSGMSAGSAATYSLLGKLLALNTIPGYSDIAEDLRIMSQIDAERVGRDISVTAALANGNIGEAVGNAMLGFVQSLPQMLLAASTGNPYAAAAVFSALSYSEKYDELAGSDMSAAGRFGYSLAWGLADGLPQAFSSFKVMSKSMNTLANGIGRESAESVIKGGLMGQFEKYSSQLLGGTLTAARGGAEGMATLYLQDLLRGELSSQDAYADAFLIEAFSDIAMSSPTILAQTKESARDLSLIALSKLPKKMPIESKVNAGKILMEKEVVEKEPELDESFKGGTSDKKQTLNDALKVTDQPQTVKEKINELNKGIKEELEKEYPNTAVLAEMENELGGIEKSISIVGGGNLKVVNDKITSLRKERDGLYKDVKSEVELQDKAKEEKRINAELKDALVEKQKIRNEIYDRSLAGIDHPLNAAANETARTKAKESVENIKQKAVVSEEKTKVAQEPAKEEMDVVEPKIEKDEKVVQEQAEVDEVVGKESIEAPESIETGKDSQEVVFKEVGGVVVLESSNPYLRADVDERTGELVQGITEEQWNDPTFLQEKAKDLKKEIAYSKKAKMDVAVETEALGVVEGRISDLKKPNGKEIETKIKELSTVEKLEAKKMVALQSAFERATRLGNVSFALDEGGKKQAISDIAGLIKDLSEAGIISLEIGAVKALDAATAYLSLRNPKVNDFVKENRKEILSEFDKIVNTVIEENKKKPDAEREIINEDFFNLFPVGVTNYYTEASRQAREKSPILKKAFEANKVFWDNILGKIESGEVNPRLIVQDIYNEQGDVAVTTERQAYILYDRVRISKERKLVQDDLDKAVESGDTNTEATLIQRLGELEIENDINDIANTKIGSEWGRFGQFRQMVVDDDYSLKSVLKDAKILNNNVTLTFQQEAKFKELTDKYNALKEEKERLESEAEKRREEFEKQDGVEFVENVKKKIVSKHKSNIKLKGKELADKIRSGKLKNKQFNFLTVVPPRTIDRAIEVVAKSIEVGSSLAQAIKQGLEYIKKTDWYKKLTSNEKTSFDEKFGIYAIRLTVDKEVNNKEYDELIENFIELSEGSINYGLNSILGDIAYNRVLAGLDTIEEIVDSIYGDIKDSIPGVTKREIRDAISGYGKFRKLSKDEVDVVLREIKRQGRLDSALEDVDKGKLPLRSGTQRDRKTEKTRRKERDIARKIKDGNLVPEPTKEELDEAWRSSEQAYIQKLENAIDDVKKELASGIKRDKAKPKEYTSPDVIRLKKELEILNEIKREKFGEPKQTPEQKREKAVINSIQRAIDRLNLDILDAIKGITPADRDLAIRSVGGDKMFGFKDKQKGSLSSKEIDKMKNLRDGLRRQLSDLMPEAIKEKALLEKYKKSRHTTLKRLQDQKAKGDYGVKPKAGVKPEDAEIVAINREIHKIKEEIEEEKERVRLAARSGMEVLAETSLDIWNLSKVMMASVDLSAPFRQGIVMIGKPKSFAKAFADMFRHALSKEYHENWLRDLKSGDMYYEMKNFGLYISEPTAKLSANEEQFMSRFIKSLGKIPVYGLALTGSERAYSGFLNKLRTDVYTNFRRQLELEGVSGQEFENEMKSYAHFINTATGRGKLGHLEPIAPILNGAFFAPRLISSRLNLALNPFFYTKMESRARKDALKTVGGFIGVVVTTLILFDIMGGDDDDDYNVEWNANSSDFLKIRKGNKRYDITGGFSQPIRTISQVFSGKVKSTKDGGFSYLSKDDFPYKTRLDVLSNFLLYKLSPSMSLVYGMLNDFESVNGEPMTVGGVLWEKALPLYVQDMIEIIEEEGAGRAIFSSIPAIFGVGVQYYGTESQILKGDILDTKRKIKRTNRDIEVLEDRVYGGDFEKSDDLRKKRKKSIELERELMMLETK